MRKAIAALTALLCLHLCTMAQQTADIEKLVNNIRHEQGMQHGVLSVCVYNVSTGKTVYKHNHDISMTPASVEKLLTTSTGFAKMGADFRFRTNVAVRGNIDRDGVLHGNIYIIGGGDPLLGSYRYRQTSPDSLFDGWTNAIKKKGIRKIDGRVCYNTSIFDEQPLHDSWQWGDVGNYYGAGTNGLNFHENMYFVYFNPGKRLGHPASAVRTQPKNINIHSTCEVTTAAENSGDNVVVYGSPTSGERLYRGTVPLGKNDFAVRCALPNPAKCCADLFATYLRTHNVGITSNSMQIYTTPDSLRQVVDYYSAPYYTIAQYTNLTSNNIYAESIFKYLGYSRYGLGTFDNGSKAVMEYIKELGLPTDGIRVVDGSGLSRLNRTTTSFLCQYLAKVAKESYYDKFLKSLAKVGESGTARNMLPSLPAGVNIYVKTGSMDGVKAYSGYITTSTGELLTFAIISNGHECSDRLAGEKLNKILHKVATIY